MRILFVIGVSEYDSTKVFVREMEAAMKAAGWQTEVLDGTDQTSYSRKREQVTGSSYDVIFTINGMLLEEDSSLGGRLLDGRVLYCTYLMDHPMIHWQRLQRKYPHMLVLCPDRNHVRFIEQYMKHIDYCAFLPHGGCVGQAFRPYEERGIDVSFMGSYTPPGEIRKMLSSYPEAMRELMEAVIALLLVQTDQTIENALKQVLSERGMHVAEEDFPGILSEFRVVDRYVRCYFRDQVIRALVENGISVDVYGHGWDKFSDEGGCLGIHPPVAYQESLDIIGNSRISLNVMPWFKDGAHDRIFTAMINGAVCLTDGSGYLQEVFREEENIYFYSLRGVRYLPAKVRKIMQKDDKGRRIAEAGRNAAQQHRWADRAYEVMDYLEQVTAFMHSQESSAVYACKADVSGRVQDGGSAGQGLACCKQDLAWYEPLCQQNALLLRMAQDAVRSLRRQEYLPGLRKMTRTIDLLTETVPRFLQYQEQIAEMGVPINGETLREMLKQLMQAQQEKDYILSADLLERVLMPLMVSMQEAYAMAVTPPDTEYSGIRLERTSCGLYTLAVQREGRWHYLHTNGDVWAEAASLAESWYEPGKCRYTVYGIGLGYHVLALVELDDSIEVTALEEDTQIWGLACQYGVGKELMKNDRVTVCVDAVHSQLPKLAAENVFVIHYPSLGGIRKDYYRKQLEDYFIEYSSARTQMRQMMGNFTRNQEYFDWEAGLLRESFQGKRVFIIAAGPSLDKNMAELAQAGPQDVVLATGTILKKLLNAGIRPDYVMITDSGHFTYHQIEGVRETEIPLLCLSTVYYRIPADYPGEKYVMFQQGFAPGEEYAAARGYDLYETGGSVTTTALDLALRLGAGEIIFVGLDLAYPGGRHHASQTANEEGIYQDAPEMVQDLEGRQIPTGRNMVLYRKWIEKRIAQEPEISFIDATEGGARIAGTKVMPLRRALEDRTDFTHFLKDMRLFIEEANGKARVDVSKELMAYLMLYYRSREGDLEDFYEQLGEALRWDEGEPKGAPYFQALSVLYALTSDPKCLEAAERRLLDGKLDIFDSENIRMQLGRIRFCRADLTVDYRVARKLNQVLLTRFEQNYPMLPGYTPYAERNQKRIVVETDSVNSYLHAPTRIVLDMCRLLQCELGYEVFLLINMPELDRERMKQFWLFSSERNYKKTAVGEFTIEYEGAQFSACQVTSCERNLIPLRDILWKIKNWKPFCIWHIGANSFLHDIYRGMTTVLSMPCTDGYSVSEAPVMLTYMESGSDLVRDQVAYIDAQGQKRYSIDIVVDYKTHQKTYAKTDFGFPKDSFIVCIVGNRLDQEMTEPFLRMLAEAASEQEKIWFAVIGECSRMVFPGISQERVKWLGMRLDLPDILQMTDLFVNPPRKGGGGGAARAAAVGVPVVTLPECDVANAVDEDFFVQDLTQMGQEIRRYCTDKAYYAEQQEKIQKLYERKYQNHTTEHVKGMLAQVREWLENGEIR